MDEIIAQLDAVIAQAKAGDDTVAGRALLISSIALVIETSSAVRLERAYGLVDEWRRIASERVGHV